MKHIALGLVVTALISTSAWAEEPTKARLTFDGALAGVSFAPAPAPAAAAAQATDDADERPVTFSAGLDIPTRYFWRGIVQNDGGFVAQPWVDFGVTLTDAVSLNVGMWNSLHSEEFTGTFYEADYYAGLSFTAGRLSPGVLYTAYTSPNDSFDTVHELALSVGFDDSESALPLSPYALVGFFSDEAGTYFEAGVEPAIPSETAVSFSVPVAIGLGSKNFYGGSFGFFKVGVAAGVDLGGGWEAHGGVDLLFLGDNTKFDDKSVKPVALVGFSYTY